MTDKTLEAMARALEDSGLYKIQRKVDLQAICADDVETACKVGCVLDVETTGTDPRRDEIIQLSAIRFRYTNDEHAQVVEILSSFNAYRQPSQPISASITALTGITNEMVAGQKIDPTEIQEFLRPVDLVIGHQAKFDYAFLHEFAPFAVLDRPWACSMTQIPWKTEAFRGLALPYLAMQVGLFSRFHDAYEDCATTLALVANRLPVSRRTGLSHLVEASSKVSHRLYAKDAPYDRKDVLKQRGYTWSGGEDGRPRGWFIDVDEGLHEEEAEFLRREVLGQRGSVKYVRVTARTRFSLDL